MEITTHWFWMIQLFFTMVLAYTIYKSMTTIGPIKPAGESQDFEFKGKFWNRWTIISLVLITLNIVSPFKLNPTTNTTNGYANNQIHKLKVELPKIKVNDSFKQSTNVQGISKGDLK